MLHFLRDFQRRHTIARPLPSFWQKTLASNAPFRGRLDASARAKLDRGIQFFVDSRIWEGCGGLGLREEHQVTIAAHAIRLTLGFDEDYFDDVGTVLVYPSPYEATSRRHIRSGVVMEGNSARLGESWYHGPVILAWSDVLKSSTPSRCAHNRTRSCGFASRWDNNQRTDRSGRGNASRSGLHPETEVAVIARVRDHVEQQTARIEHFLLGPITHRARFDWKVSAKSLKDAIRKKTVTKQTNWYGQCNKSFINHPTSQRYRLDCRPHRTFASNT